MAIPTYDQIMLPLLQALEDGQLHTNRELSQRMADHFQLTPEERASMLPSTRVNRIKHRTGWAAFGLRRAGLADNPVKGSVHITEEGKRFLATNPTELTSKGLMQFEPFRQFVAGMKARNTSSGRKTQGLSQSAPEPPLDEQTTPEERMESAFA